jgi:hypothetical protein
MPIEPVKILLKNWKRMNPRIIQGSLFPSVLAPYIWEGIPMDKHLVELISIPEIDTNDFLHVYRAKFLPQKYDYQSQELLRKYSNEIIDELNKNRVHGKNPSPVDEYLLDFCNRHVHCYNYLEYCQLTIRYFGFLLPQLPLISEEKKHFLADLQSTLDDNALFSDSKYYKRAGSSRRVFRRFSFLEEMFYEISLVEVMIEQAGEAQKFRDLVLGLDSDHQVRWRGRKARKSLRQCVFCYRFFEGVGRVPRTCSNTECQQSDRAWKSLLDSKGFSPEDFGFFNRVET